MAPETTAFDSNVIIAALLSWHEHHDVASRSLRAALSDTAATILPAPALLEAYAVMTRLPPPHRLACADAHRLLSANFRRRTRVVSLEGDDLWTLLDTLVGIGAAGGLTYDAQIVACARKAGAKRVLTLNRRDFARLDTAGLAIVDPREPG